MRHQLDNTHLFIYCLSIFYMRFILFNSCYGALSDSFYFTVSPNNQDVEEGQPLRLRCAVTPSKDIYYSWLHNGSSLELEKENGRRYLEVDSDLQILHADRELDPGTYQCQALNRSSTFATASREAKVNIYWMDPDVHVLLVKPLQFENIRLGEELELSCHVQANPPLTAANIKWFYNGNARLPNTEFLNNGNLRIAVFGIEHTGSYHCRVVHAAGKLDSKSPFIVQITGDPPGQLITNLRNEDFSKFIVRGRSVELVCPQINSPKQLDGITPITVWGFMPRLGEQQQPVSTLKDVQYADQDRKLVFPNFDVHHVNYYICEISWPGSTDKYVFIFQLEMAALYYPKRSDFSPRLKKNQPYVIRIGEDANLRYYSDQSPSISFSSDQISNPNPVIEWHKKGEHQSVPTWPPPEPGLVDLSAPPRIYALRGRHLIIHSVRETDSGTYEMVLTNVAGRASITFDILVNFPPEFFQPLTHEELALDENSPLTLDCGIKKRAIPGSIVYWEKDQRVLEKYANSLMVLENNGETLRFPELKPDDQGQYQCFVQTDGYKQRWSGREQTVIVKAKLQFTREIKEHFLEINAQGRIPCKARGHGTVTVDWFRKIGPRLTDLEPIHPPNQVESGTLIIQYVQKEDAGEYVCIAKSTYQNSEINMTVKVVVGEKPQISQISSNQTVRVGTHMLLNCYASGDPSPQISWIVKKIGFKIPNVYTPFNENDVKLTENLLDPNTEFKQNQLIHTEKTLDSNVIKETNEHSDLITNIDHGNTNENKLLHSENIYSSISRQLPLANDRIRAYPNGSLVIKHVLLTDQAEYICVAGNKHAIKTRQGVFVQVLTPEEYSRQLLGEDSTSSGMLRTIFIVVGCAVTYLGLIIGLTVFCSMRMLRTRRNRSQKVGKLYENGQLLSAIGETPGHRGGTRDSQGSGGPAVSSLENGPLITTCTAGMNGITNNSALTQFSPHGQNGTNYSDTTTDFRSHPLICSAQGSNSVIPQHDSKLWWPMSDHVYYGQSDAQGKLLQSTPIEGFINPLTDNSALNGQTYMHSMLSPQYNLMFSGRKELSTGVGSSTIATTICESHLVSAPPPTPLDSHSHFSGVSSGNSTSLYSRSLLSGASNFAPTSNQGTQQQLNGVSPYDPSHGLHTISQTDRMNYPRCELRIEGMLGKGEFGEVFLARARHILEGEPQSLVLVKSLSSRNPAHVNEFHRQLELFGQSDHDYVTRLLGVCMEQEPFYLILEYCEWGDLKQFLRCMREENAMSFNIPSLNQGQKLNLSKQLALGMDYLARTHCIHRDLAARNVLLTQDLQVKISNLALARDVYANEYYRLPNTEYFIPLRWFAPELIHDATIATTNGLQKNLPVFNGESDLSHASPTAALINYTTNSDVWAFGVLICELFTLAALPLARLSDQEIIMAGQRTVIHNLSNGTTVNTNTINTKTNSSQLPLKPDLPADLPVELANLLNRCWSPIPQNRPSFSEIVVILRDLTS